MLRTAGWTVETLRVEELSIKPCVGCFGCWLKTPGECGRQDDGRTVARASIQSDAAFLLTPVSFGGYSGLLKTAIDRLIPNVSPLFEKIDGEMHHKQRYPYKQEFYVVGWQRQPNAESAAILAQLAHRNAINMHSVRSACVVITSVHAEAEQRALLAGVVHPVEVTA
jgi:multimeric flavodoxin WrbA